MKKYRKLFAALIGVGAMTAVEFAGADPESAAQGAQMGNTLVDAVIGLGTLVGVWAAPNSD